MSRNLRGRIARLEQGGTTDVETPMAFWDWLLCGIPFDGADAVIHTAHDDDDDELERMIREAGMPGALRPLSPLPADD